MQKIPKNLVFFEGNCLSLLLDTTKTSLTTSFDIIFSNIKSKSSNKFYKTILLLHTCSHETDSSHSILGENGCCVVAKLRLKLSNYFIYHTVSDKQTYIR